ncbi:CDP-diacylglycerol--serine O-phosphatidyltransferase [Flammeovirga kamogawensis]|uniref:CDP-diacylglycerol--serine O-phosphatidyltransferase n=1 Tax=Flammeovirga kamogawensis TaxID=373891 RepID=A0ABX8GWX4_9BACT|nr:CDP-diacylglycerol--serine O-phosphatidyltransferase [Flammeovirga kamogawensis]MBB6460681.1 CDP-diacylglycerol--serine O-phosphatidyltransferase [Flammeovirga kamogawensis]QWG08036.1 CDP-diacylglycerol--serine O-phosphatidyltransferase [Flammeovirga kamogawensis]TRX69843.1 CDP-diacylglycerol--serine O-phosphatidyltransferase [Flammeovirga kamogawensis]
MGIKRHIPNAITCGNLLSGCFGISQCFEGNLILGASMIIVGAGFDFFDGFAARMLKVSSPVGKELDSLADMVTFGVLPAVILYQLFLQLNVHEYIPYLAFLIAAFSAVRLANFNVDERQSDGFIGVPTPANALLIGSLPLIIDMYPQFTPYVMNEYVLIGIVVVMSYLLNAELPLVSLKFKNFGWKGNESRYILIGISILLLLFLQVAALPLIVVTQVAVSMVFKK